MSRGELYVGKTPDGYRMYKRKQSAFWSSAFLIGLGLYTVGTTNDTWLFVPFLAATIFNIWASRRIFDMKTREIMREQAEAESHNS